MSVITILNLKSSLEKGAIKRAICAGAFQRDQKPSSSSWR